MYSDFLHNFVNKNSFLYCKEAIKNTNIIFNRVHIFEFDNHGFLD